MEVDVRAADTHDVGRIAQINETSWRATYAGIIAESVLATKNARDLEPQWLAYVQNPDTPEDRLWVVSLGGRVCGYARSGPGRDDDVDSAKVAEIYGFYLDPAAWGHGVGRMLMDRCLEDLKERGYSESVLWVTTENARARGFYEHLGFSVDGRDDKPFLGAPQIRYRAVL